MPVISRFNGIVIKMYLRQKDHNPPHIHAICGENMGMFCYFSVLRQALRCWRSESE